MSTNYTLKVKLVAMLPKIKNYTEHCLNRHLILNEYKLYSLSKTGSNATEDKELHLTLTQSLSHTQLLVQIILFK